MQNRVWQIVVAVVALQGMAFTAYADPNWASLPFTDAKTLEAVDADGNPTYSPSGFPLKMIGVVLNTPSDMSDSTPNPSNIPFDVSTYWQTFIQTTDINNDGDFGGVALYMAQNYGNIPPNLTFPDGVPTPDPTASYANQEWQNQLNRVNNYAQNTIPAPHQLEAGDLVEVLVRGGLFFGGKYNINEEHIKTPDYSTDKGLSFDVIYLGHPGLPTPIPLQLSDIWDNSTNAVTFDPTRATGGEHYQGDYVNLENVRLLPGQSANWSANGFVTVQDTAGHQFTVELGTNTLFAPGNAPSGWFNATGIFDQEAPSGGPFTGGYELWITDPHAVSASTTLIAGDVNYDGIVNGQDIAAAASDWLGTGTNPAGDANGDGIVNGQDIALIASNWLHTSGAGATTMAVPEPSSLALLAIGAAFVARRRSRLK